MKVLNIEDNVYKHVSISRILKRLGINEIEWKQNLLEAVEELTDNPQYDLVITDMWYPEYPGGPDAKSGEVFIEKVKENNWTCKVILCSSMDYLWPGIYGSVHYSEESDWEVKLINLIRNMQHS